MNRRPYTVCLARLLKACCAVMMLTAAFSLTIPMRAYAHGVNLGTVTDIFKVADERRAEAAAVVAARRQAAPEQPVSDRQAACETIRADVSATMKNFYTKATQQTYLLDAIFENVHTYYDGLSLNKTDLDSLLQEAADAYLMAQVEAGVLSLLNEEINCNDPDVSIKIVAFSSSVKSIRVVLDTYRTVLHKLVSSLSSAVAQQASGGRKVMRV